MEEQELVLRCARKDKTAQRELYLQYRSRILALCRRYADNPADAEDLMQDAFIKIFKSIGNFKWTRPGSLYSWMSRISINLAFDTAKLRRRLASQLVDIDNMESDISEEPAYDETASVPSDVLNEMIGSLPEGYRTVFRLYCIDGLSHREIGDLLGIKEKSSSASLSRARAMLAEAIRQYWRNIDEGAAPEDWTNILRKMRREETARSIKLVLALLIPVATLMLWLQPRQSNGSFAPHISQIIAEDNPSVIIPHTFPSPRELADMRSVISGSPTDIQTALSDTSFKYSDIPSKTYEVPHEEDTLAPYKEDDSQMTAYTALDDFPGYTEEVRRSRPRISLNLKAGSSSSRRNSMVSLKSSMYMATLTYMNMLEPNAIPDTKTNPNNIFPWYCEGDIPTNTTNRYSHDLPLTFSLTARMDITSRIGAECGIDYTFMHSDVETETEVGQLSQNLHFIGIPLRFDTRIWSWNGFDMYAGIGVKAEKCIAASLGQVQCDERRLQWSTETFAGAQCNIGRRTHLYFQPELSYYLTKTDLITYRTENPLTFSLNAGIRFDL